MTDSQFFRANPDYAIELRAGGDGRTISGIAVPYGKSQRIDSRLTEGFMRGAFNKQVSAPGRVPLARDHIPHGGTPIGKVTLMRDDAAGLYVEARVSKTPLGDETLALLDDGVLQDWSIGFREGQNQMRGGTTWRQTAHMTELAIVNRGAYGESASVSAIREETEHFDCPKCAADAVQRGNADNLAELLRGLPALPLPPIPRRSA